MDDACPTCGARGTERRDNPHRPFCSQRCQQLDLGKWLDEDYVVKEPLIPGMPMREDTDEVPQS